MSMKLIFEGWRRFVNEGDVLQLPSKASTGGMEYISLTGKQALELEKFVNQFGGASIMPLLEPAAAEEPLKMVAEQEEGEQEAEVPAATEKPKRLTTKIPKDDPRTIGDLTPQEFEKGNYVIPVEKNISMYFEQMINELRQVGDAVEQAKSWYYDVNDIVKSIVKDENEHVLFSALLAAFSHNTDFYRNLLEAIFGLRAYQFDMQQNKECLEQYITSIPEHKVDAKFGKLKLTNFALNILDPTFAEKPPNSWNSTMDRWMFRAFYPGWPESAIKKMVGKNIAYIYLTRVLAEEAKKFDMAPHQLQAVLWVAIMYQRRGRIDTLSPLLLKMKNQFMTDMDKLETEMQEVESLTTIIPKIFNAMKDPADLRVNIKKVSSDDKKLALQAFEDRVGDIGDDECDPEKLNLYYVLENYVGMRTDKKKNMRNIFLTAIEGKWNIADGVKYFSGLVNLRAKKASEIIP